MSYKICLNGRQVLARNRLPVQAPLRPKSRPCGTKVYSFTSTQVLDEPETRPAVQLSVSSGDVMATPDAVVQVGVGQPVYGVRVLYRSRGRPLEGASRVWAHIGHSGWRDTRDVELTNTDPGDGTAHQEVWQGSYQVPAGRLAAPWHLETQMVFRGLMAGGHEAWDNNGGANWSVAVEVAPGEGLVQALNPSFASTRSLTSSLLLRLEALVASRLLSPEQGSVLRMLAWQHDLATVKAYEAVRNLDDKSVAGALAGRCAWLRPPGLNVVHVASEMAPIAKVGGLADVVSSLAKAHQATGLLTEVILPKYDCIQYGEVHELRQMSELEVPWGPPEDPHRTVRTVVWSGCVEGLPVYFIEPHCPERYFWRGKFYGEPDDAARFAFFSRAALEFLVRRQHEAPDVIHCHDWQAAAVGPLLKETYRASGLSRTRSVLTIHNLAFQGHISGSFLHHMGLAPRAAHVTQPDVMLQPTANYHKHQGNGDHVSIHPSGMGGLAHMTLNLLKGAIVYADRLTTVSPTYAREVLGDEQLGMGLRHLLAAHRHKLTGVLNGLDYETWNPATDPCLPAHFTPEDTRGKRLCKAALCRELGLPFDGVLPGPATTAFNGGGNGRNGNGHEHSNGHEIANEGAAAASGAGGNCGGGWGPGGRPLVAIVSRLTEQKGLPLMAAGLRAAVEAGAQVVVLGSAPDPKVQREWEALAREVSAGGDARIVLRHDEALSHRIFAGADMLLVPSMFEPCGLTQLIALRYGTVPVVRETGGLADTVHDVAHGAALPERERNGFTFGAPDVGAVQTALRRAISAYRDGAEWWCGELVPRVMRQDWGWSQSAQRYQEVYAAALMDA